MIPVECIILSKGGRNMLPCTWVVESDSIGRLAHRHRTSSQASSSKLVRSCVCHLDTVLPPPPSPHLSPYCSMAPFYKLPIEIVVKILKGAHLEDIVTLMRVRHRLKPYVHDN